jgi:hypothetical protein
MYNESSSPVLSNVTISGNSADYGGGMVNINSSPVLTNVTISGNSASDSIIIGGGGGMYNYYSSPVLTNVSFSGNSADQGGGMYNYASLPVLINVTLSGNSADQRGGGMFNNTSSSPQIRNSIIWGNTAPLLYGPGMYNDDTSNVPAITYSIVQGSTGSGDGWSLSGSTNGGGNVPDPGTGAAYSPFVNWIDPSAGTATDGGDYHLTSGSPAINKGSNSLYPDAVVIQGLLPSEVTLSPEVKAAINAVLEKDAGGDSRFNSVIDMGAYESGFTW